MGSLRGDPRIQREISNLFDRVLGTTEAALAGGARSVEWVPPMEAFYHGGAQVTVEVAGSGEKMLASAAR
ncbi:MAG: hypothetical protein QN196_01580 [Armatimonadota bacterium]|nr:hypothetical protein [Armatimonadota bacterium]